LNGISLLAQIKDEDLLFSLVHELGSTFWQQCEDGTIKVVYFSSHKIVYFNGKISKDHKKTLECDAWKVKNLDLDETNGFVRITQ